MIDVDPAYPTLTPEQQALNDKWIKKIRLDLLRIRYKKTTSERKRYFIERKANQLKRTMELVEQ